ncbi:MAG TPA: iron chelate uptake ABC transporter family permease subunit [Plantibacter sp.]|nr:iron chelate uptake ABC transporter family permease subunit [Plantibacter sp.]
MSALVERPDARTREPVELFGRRRVVLRVAGGSALIDVRSLVVCLALAAVALACGVAALALGDYPIAVPQILLAVTGGADPLEQMVVVEWRLPRVVAALVLGGALGVSGAIFQSITRNPLGSPDIIGFNTGAYTGALVVMLLLGGSGSTGFGSVAAGAMVGGLATAALVFLLAYRRGVQGFRLIIVGIAVSATLASLNTWMLLEAELGDAMAAAVWGAGSLNAVGWTQVGPLVVAMVLLLPVLVVIAPSLGMLELGDDPARASGIRAERTRLVAMFVGVALTALVTAAAGPIAFVALSAPQLARRLTASASVGLLPSAVMGATLLLASDPHRPACVRTRATARRCRDSLHRRCVPPMAAGQGGEATLGGPLESRPRNGTLSLESSCDASRTTEDEHLLSDDRWTPAGCSGRSSCRFSGRNTSNRDRWRSRPSALAAPTPRRRNA